MRTRRPTTRTLAAGGDRHVGCSACTASPRHRPGPWADEPQDRCRARRVRGWVCRVLRGMQSHRSGSRSGWPSSPAARRSCSSSHPATRASMNALISGCGGRVPRRRKSKARRRISLVSRSRLFSAFSAGSSSSVEVGKPSRWPSSMSAWTTQRRRVFSLIPSCLPTIATPGHRPVLDQVLADHSDRPSLDLRIELPGHTSSFLTATKRHRTRDAAL